MRSGRASNPGWSSTTGSVPDGSATSGTDKIWVEAYNGQWSNEAEVDITDPGVAAPVVTAHDQTVSDGQEVALSNLISASGCNFTHARAVRTGPNRLPKTRIYEALI